MYKQNVLNRPSQLNIIVSTQEGNKFFQGNYYNTANKDSEAKYVDSLRDFRKIVSFEKIDFERNFV